MWYSTLFLRLYSKILEDDLIQNDVTEGDVQQAIRYMHEVYRGNPENLSKESYSITNYNNLAYRCAYLFKYAPIHTALVYEAMSRALTENPHTFRLFQDLVFLKTPFNICSLGSGPGTDVIGVLAALYDKLCFFPSSATLVDIMPEWEGTFRSVVSELRLEDRTYGILSASASQRYFDWSFIDSDLLEEVSQDLKLVIESANLITLVKFVSAVACKKTSEMIEHEVYDAFHSTKPESACEQTIGAESADMHAAHRFLDIQIISNKLGAAPVAHLATPSYFDVYKPISTSGHREFLLSSG
ncbi:hypothetical protein AVEN_185879-1 [Araneus ventricosus]|uniref:Uncharacterized protein n=1 Tax=Araneus ventricosus TaxID=182803 RepID=A0A4Y2QFC3_ARAVE|nr:hypothetical protein AVEN_185879-1 [Araneus ventricosus]